MRISRNLTVGFSTLWLSTSLAASPIPASTAEYRAATEFVEGSDQNRGGSPQSGGAGDEKSGGQDAKSGGQDEKSSGQDEKSIQRKRAALRASGPEAKARREAAVEELLAMADPRAHALLQEYVVPGTDPDGLRRHVLARLPAKFRSAIDEVFATSSNRDLIRRSYAKALARHFTGAENDPPAILAQRRLARAAIVAMGAAELADSFSMLLKDGDLAVRHQALRAAGESQKLVLARFVAAHIETTELAQVARHALSNLTYCNFTDRAAFAKWWQENKHRSYFDVVEEAARRAAIFVRETRGEMDRKHIATVVKFIEVLAQSDKTDKWKLIKEEVFAPEPEGLMQACLLRLRQVLADPATVANSSGASTNGSHAADRQAFFDELARRLQDGPEAGDYALLLEVASHLCLPAETKRWTAQQDRLLQGLRHATRDVQLAALRGLRRFFSPANRAAVVAAVGRAHGRGELELLGVAIETLKSEGWQAPAATDADAKDWVDVLRGMLRDDALTVATGNEVIKVLSLSGPKGRKLPSVFQLMLAEVARESTGKELRQSMMLRLIDLLPSEAGAARDAAAGEYLKQLSTLQDDEVAVEIRRDAASLLDVPKNLSKEQQLALGKALVQAAGARLLLEVDDRVFEALVLVLEKLARKEVHVAAVNTRLRQALEKLREDPKNSSRVQSLVDGLRRVAVQERQITAEWYETCRLLLEPPLRDRSSIRRVLDYHLRDNGRKLALERVELQHRVWKLVIHTANLRPDDQSWSNGKDNGKDEGEAKMVLQAFKGLMESGEYEKDEANLDTARTRLTYLRCLAASGDPQTLETRCRAWLVSTDETLKDRDRDEARLLFAQGLLTQGKHAAAWSESSIQSVTGTLIGERLRITAAIADALLQENQPAQALPLLADVVQHTKPDAAAYWPRFRRHLEVRHGLDPKAAAALLMELDGWAKDRSKLGAEVRKEIDALRAVLRRSAAKSKPVDAGKKKRPDAGKKKDSADKARKNVPVPPRKAAGPGEAGAAGK